MPDNFFSRAKADGQVFMKTVNLVTKISKLKLEIRARMHEKERLLKVVGVETFGLYQQNGSVDGPMILQTVSGDLKEIDSLEHEIRNLEAEIKDLQAKFRAQGGKEEPQSGKEGTQSIGDSSGKQS